jgi:hypothetical protein
MELENFSSVKAKTRRITPAAIFIEGVAPRPTTSRGGPDFAEPLRQDGERAGRDVPVLERGYHVLDRPDFGCGQSMGRRMRTGRLIVKCTRVHACSRCRQAWNRLGDNRKNRRSARNGTNARARSTAPRIPI